MAKISIPTIQELTDQIVDNYESELGEDIPVLQKAFVRVWARVKAGVIYLGYRHSLWVLKQAFAETAGREALERMGRDYRLTPIPPVTQKIIVSFDGAEGTTLPTNRSLTIGDKVFITRVSGSVGVGDSSLTVECEAQTPGVEGGALVGDEATLVREIPGLSAEGVVTTVTREAFNAEELESFRERVLAERRNPPQGGSTPDWVRWAREVPGVVRVLAFRTAPGEVTVYPLVGFTLGDRLPDSNKLTEITDYISDPVRRPLNCENASAVLFTEQEFDVVITNLTPDTADLRSRITTAIENYLVSRFPKQYVIQPGNQAVVSTMDIYSVCRDAGAESVNVQLDRVGGGLNIPAYELLNSELAKPGSITIV